MAIPANNRESDFVRNTFPNICRNYEIIDGLDVGADYNCVSLAINDFKRSYWPGTDFMYWPDNILDEDCLNAFQELFESQGFVPCGLNDRFEMGFEKIAIYINGDGAPTHVAKQLIGDNGCWRSKLGTRDLIKHTLGGLCGSFNDGSYGNVAIIMKREAQIALL